MEALLNALNVGGDVGVWVLVLVVWRFHDRILKLELRFQGEIDRRLEEIDAELLRMRNRLHDMNNSLNSISLHGYIKQNP